MADEGTEDLTVSDLAAFVDRSKKALAEAGRTDLARRAHVTVDDQGSVSLSFAPEVPSDHPRSSQVLKALELDPMIGASDG